MSNDPERQRDEKLTGLLRAARPKADLPPGFHANVWRRIEGGEPVSGGVFEQLAGWLLKPRVAVAGLAVVLLIGSAAGAMHGLRSGERAGRNRYLASVDPAHLTR